MKKFYIFTLSVLVAMSALAGGRINADAFKDAKLITDDALAKSIIGKKVDLTQVRAASANKNGMVKAPAKVAQMSEALGEFDCTYTDYFNPSAPVNGTAKFIWSDQYEDIEVTIPEAPLDFGADWDETNGAVVFSQANFGQNSNGYIFQVPINGTSIVSKISVPYNSSTNSYEFDEAYGLAFAAVDPSSYNILGYYFRASKFQIGRSSFDYKLTLTTSGECSPNNEFKFTVTGGEDIKSAKVIMLPDADMEAADAKAYFAQLGQAITLGTEYVISPEEDMEATGPFALLVAGYNEAGEIVKTTEATFIVVLEENDKWQTIATLPYDNAIVSSYYTFTYTNEACELQENKEKPWQFRLVNPHAGHTYLHAADCPHYIYFDATDPEFVNIPFSPTGVDFGDGQLVVGTFGGALGYSKEQCTAKGFAVGSRQGRSLVFPQKSVLAHESNYNKPGSWSFMNNNSNLSAEENTITYVLPDLTLKVTALDVNGNPIEGVVLSYGEATATTDAEGVATIALPADVDYLATIELAAQFANEDMKYIMGIDDTYNVKLNGAASEYTLNTELDTVENQICNLTVIVNDEEGEPIADATVFVGEDFTEFTTDENGKVTTTIKGVLGTKVPVWVMKDGYEFFEGEADFTEGMDAYVIATLEAMTCTATIKVMDEEGEPVADALVTVNNVELTTNDYGLVNTSIKGAFGTKVPYTVYKDGYEFFEDELDFTEGDSYYAVATLETATCELTVAVIDQQGEPVEDAYVTVDGKTYTTLSNGRCTIELKGVLFTKVPVTVEKEGYKKFEGEADFTEGLEYTLVATLEAEGSALNVITVDANGEAVIYDLQGRRVHNPSTGIYIINGEKVLLKGNK